METILHIDFKQLDRDIAAHIARRQADGGIPADFTGHLRGWYEAGFTAGACHARKQFQATLDAERVAA